MAGRLQHVEISDVDNLTALVEEVRRSGTPRILRRGGEDVAILSPAPGRRRTSARSATLRPPSAAEVARSRAGIEAAIGSWRDVDVDALKAALRRQRAVVTRQDARL